jgi:nitrate/TMAO reductase-like tetraheme cytochrome c subunit
MNIYQIRGTVLLKLKNLIKLIFSSRKNMALAVVALFVIGILGLIGVLEVTSQPIFCSSCHYMSDYYEQWKHSSHHKVPCLECHAKPGLGNYLVRKYVAIHEVVSMMTGKYPPRPHAEVDDASCLRKGCHETRVLKGKVDLKGVTFDHTPHLTQDRRGRKLRCTSCHAQMAMGRHIAVTEEVCFLCHFKGRMQTPEANTSAFCLKCHKMPDTAVTIRGTKETYNHKDYVGPNVKCQYCHSNIIRGEGQVPKVMCFQCHNKPENIARYNDLEFIHENHITKHKVECYMCHTEIEHSIKPSDHPYSPEQSMTSCTQCHGSRHSSSEQLYAGTGARSVGTVTSAMYRAHVACKGCHRVTDQDSGVLGAKHFPIANVSVCVDCHGNDGKSYLSDWQDQIKKATAAAAATLAKIQAKPQLLKDANNKKIFEDAKYNIEFVKSAHGEHNVEYAVSILEQSKAQLEKLLLTK